MISIHILKISYFSQKIYKYYQGAKQVLGQYSAYKVRLRNNDEGMKIYRTKLKHGDVRVDYSESAKSLQPIECNKSGDIVLLLDLLSKIFR